MHKIILLLAFATLLAGCQTSYPPTSMYNEYGFTYDYRPSAVPAVPLAETTAAPSYVIQVPPPTIIYQTTPATPAPVQLPADTNVVAEVSPGADPNPYLGSDIIPPKVAVVPEQTIIHEFAGAAAGITVTNTNAVTQLGAGYPGPILETETTNGAGRSINVTNANSRSIPNKVNEPSAGERIIDPPPTAPVPQLPKPLTPPPSTPPEASSQQPNTSQSTTGSGTGQPAQTTTGGSFAPPPPGTTPLPGTTPRKTVSP